MVAGREGDDFKAAWLIHANGPPEYLESHRPNQGRPDRVQGMFCAPCIVITGHYADLLHTECLPFPGSRMCLHDG
jgi:hypothetical protein